MKKNLLLTTFILFALTLPANALITPEESISNQYIQNQGYSAEMARLIDIRCAQAAARVPEIDTSEPECYKNFNWIRKLFIYLDPALDDGSFMRHNVKPTPSVHDL